MHSADEAPISCWLIIIDVTIQFPSSSVVVVAVVVVVVVVVVIYILI